MTRKGAGGVGAGNARPEPALPAGSPAKAQGARAMPRPRPQAYQCYRRFLEDFYLHKKSLRAGFTFRRFAQLAEVKSPNYLQLVMRGQRNLSNALAPRVAAAMGLSHAESCYFDALVRRANAQDPAEREKAERALLGAMKRILTKEIPAAQDEIIAKWHHLVVRELAFLPNFQADGAWISRELRDLITPEQAQRSLEFLEKSGYLAADPEGRLRPAEPVLDTGDKPDGSDAPARRLRILEMHLQVLSLWTRLLPQLAHEERELGLLNLPLAADRVPELKRRLRAFQDEIIGWAEAEGNADRVLQVGVYMVPMSRG